MSEEKSVFETLSSIDVGNKVRQKGKFYYVSWSEAVRQLLKHYPKSTWSFTLFEGLPFMRSPAGAFVECTVVVGDLSRTQMLPILDLKNKPVMDPDSNQVNKAHMRALTKAIALHGFGLQLWAGEDIDGDEHQDTGEVDFYSEECFNASWPAWLEAVAGGRYTPDTLLAFLAEKNIRLSDSQIEKVKLIGG